MKPRRGVLSLSLEILWCDSGEGESPRCIPVDVRTYALQTGFRVSWNAMGRRPAAKLCAAQSLTPTPAPEGSKGSGAAVSGGKPAAL